MTSVPLDFDVHGPQDGPVLVLVAGLGTQRHWWPPDLVALLAEDAAGCTRVTPPEDVADDEFVIGGLYVECP